MGLVLTSGGSEATFGFVFVFVFVFVLIDVPDYDGATLRGGAS